MRGKFWALARIFAGGASIAAVGLTSAVPNEPLPPALAAAGSWAPAPLAMPQLTGLPEINVAGARPEPTTMRRPPAPPETTSADTSIALAAAKPQLSSWSRKIASGDTLDAVLAEAGLEATDRSEVALALGAEFDLRHLRPGHEIEVVSTPEGRPYTVALDIDEGVRIEAVFGERPSTRVVTPDPEIVTLAGQAVIDSSVYSALQKSGMPARFAVDLAQMLGGTVNFRRELKGGETLRLLWREARVRGDIVGEPEIAFAALDLKDALYEVIWPNDGSGQATIYMDGEVLRVFSQPVAGARLSSVFGRRKHPVFDDMRMHTGVDFAAPLGTPVQATAPGRVAFIGWRNGYGRVVEIAHGADILTRYAHLSAVPEGVSEGRPVTAGDLIGRVGETGTTTAPNLHYEVLVDGRPTDPLGETPFAQIANSARDDNAALDRLAEVRARIEQELAQTRVDDPTERL